MTTVHRATRGSVEDASSPSLTGLLRVSALLHVTAGAVMLGQWPHVEHGLAAREALDGCEIVGIVDVGEDPPAAPARAVRLELPVDQGRTIGEHMFASHLRRADKAAAPPAGHLVVIVRATRAPLPYVVPSMG